MVSTSVYSVMKGIMMKRCLNLSFCSIKSNDNSFDLVLTKKIDANFYFPPFKMQIRDKVVDIHPH